jgi:DNA-binding MarR family transcriptional regulator
MDSKALFNELLHRLRKYEDGKYSDAMLLHYLLRQGADDSEFKSTAVKVALDALSGCLNRWEVQRSIDRLSQLGLISTRVHANTRTHFTVNREAVLALLAKPLPRNLPGIDERHFPFLDEWKAAQKAAGSADSANEQNNPEVLPQPVQNT